MIHDEDTTEIEIPGYQKKPDNVVRVNFSASPSTTVETASVQATPPAASPKVTWLRELDPAAPWILRLLGALLIVGLSLLIL